MKKKGFTLTEMIAVIVILAIIIALGTVAFTGIRKSVLEKEYNNMVSYLETKAANYTENTGELNVSVERLIEAGYVSADEANKILDPRTKESMNCIMLESTYENGNYKAKMGDSIGEATSGKCNTYEISKEIQICVMQSNGSCSTNIADWYNDNITLGVLIGNNFELSKTASIVWKANGASINAQTITTDVTAINKGTYTVEVKYDDQKEGETLKHFEGTDTVAVSIDKLKPTINNNIKVDKANEWTNTDKVMSMSFSDGNGSGVYGVYVGTKSCGAVQSNEWSKSKTVEYSKSLGMGTYHLCVIDNAGNISDDSKTVTIAYIDKNPPTCNVVISDVDGENGWHIHNAKIGLTYSDHDGNPNESGVVSYDLTTVNTPSYKGNNSSEQGDTAGTTYYGYVKDRAGNTATCSGMVKVDTLKPTCNITEPGADGKNNWYKGNVTLTLNETQKVSPIVGRDLTTSTIPTYTGIRSKTQSEDTTGTTYYGYVKAESGLTNSCSKTVKVDKHDPECTIIVPNPDGSNNWYLGNVTLTLNTTKKISNIVGYDLTASSSTSYNKTTSRTHTTDTAGTTYYCYVESESGRTGSNTKTIKVDKQDPACNITAPAIDGENGWYKENVTLTLNETPKTSTIVARDITTSSSASYSGSRSKTQTNDTNGITYYGYVKADSGRTGSCSKAIKKDNTKPTCSVSATGTTSNGYYVSSVSLSLSTSGDSGSPISTYGLATSSTANYNKSTKATHTVTGNVTYYGYVKDQAGNANSCSKTINVDVTAPTVTSMSITKQSAYSYNSKNVTVTMGGGDTGSGIAAYCYTTSNNSGTCTWVSSTSSSFSQNSTFGTDGSGQTITLYGFVKDQAGNISVSKNADYTLYKTCSQTTARASDSRGGCNTSCGTGKRTVTHYWKDSYFGTTCSNTTTTEDCYDDSGCCWDYCSCYGCPPEPAPEPACDWQCQVAANSAAWFDADASGKEALHAANEQLYADNCPSCTYNSSSGEWHDGNGNCTNCR